MTDWKFLAAKSTETSAEILKSLLQYPQCRLHLAGNPSCTTEILDELSLSDAFNDFDDENTEITGFTRVLTHPNTSQATIEKVLEHHPELEECLSSNPNAPVRILTKLTLSDDDTILRKLRGNPSSPRKFLSKSFEEIMKFEKWDDAIYHYTLCHNRSLLKSELESLSRHPVYQIRSSVAENESTTNKLLFTMINDESDWVRRSVAMNKNSEIGTLQALAFDTSRLKPSYGLDRSNNGARFVYHQIMGNPNCTQELKNFINTLDWKARNLQ